MRKIAALFLMLLGALSCAAGEKRALVYMLDGMRADMIETSPVWQDLKANRWAEPYRALWSVDASNDPYTKTNSAPNHTLIATGFSADVHKVTDNKFLGNFDAAAAPVFLQTLNRRLHIPVLYAFSWGPDKMLIPECPAIVLGADDIRNMERLHAILQRPDAPEAILVLDDGPDGGGHHTGFYPYGEEYITRTEAAMTRLARLLTAIRERPTFEKEDWLIVICADHGGLGTGHGMAGGQASTVPLLFCGRNLPAGRIAGRPDNASIAPMVLRHFGLADEAAKLPGSCDFAVKEEPPPSPPERGLIYDLAVREKGLVNAAGAGGGINLKSEVWGAGGFSLRGTMPVGGGAFELSNAGWLLLDALRGRGEEDFSFAIEMEIDPAEIGDEAVPVFGNKRVGEGDEPGFCFFWREKMLRANFGRDPALPADYLAPKPERLDLWGFGSAADKPTLVAASVGRDGLVTLLQKHPDGHTYWFSVKRAGLRLSSGRDWILGWDNAEDARGDVVRIRPYGKIYRFRFWDRALTLEELRALELR